MSEVSPRIADHPVLTFVPGRRVTFTFDGREFEGYEGEPIAAVPHAAGVRVLAHSPVRPKKASSCSPRDPVGTWCDS